MSGDAAASAGHSISDQIVRATVWFTGLPGAGKTTVATTLRSQLDARSARTYMLDGDVLRRGLNSDLGYGEEDRAENVRRVGEVALLFSSAGHLSLVTVISPYHAGRSAVRARHAQEGVPFLEVYVATPLEICERRDPKGMYARARRGELERFTGVSAPYEPPADADLEIVASDKSPDESAAEVLELLLQRGLVKS